MEDWITCGWWTPVILDTWPESLNGSPASLSCFSCVWFLWEFGLWLFSVVDSFGSHSFSHSMNTHEPNMRLHLFDRFLDSCSCGLGRVRGHLLKLLLLVHDFVLFMLLLVLLMLFPWELLAIFPNNHTRSFPRVNISRHASKGESKTSFSNQILQHANPHDKLSAFVCIEILGSQVFTD
jgi:hypothetical protein